MFSSIEYHQKVTYPSMYAHTDAEIDDISDVDGRVPSRDSDLQEQ